MRTLLASLGSPSLLDAVTSATAAEVPFTPLTPAILVSRSNATFTSASNFTPSAYTALLTPKSAGYALLSTYHLQPGGLKGEYFSNPTLAGLPLLTRTDSQVNFTWGLGPVFEVTRCAPCGSGALAVAPGSCLLPGGGGDWGGNATASQAAPLLGMFSRAWGSARLGREAGGADGGGGVGAAGASDTPPSPEAQLRDSVLAQTRSLLGGRGLQPPSAILTPPPPSAACSLGTFSSGVSARWTGAVVLPPGTGGDYQFTLTGDDGVRLWVNGELLIDAWGSVSGSYDGLVWGGGGSSGGGGGGGGQAAPFPYDSGDGAYASRRRGDERSNPWRAIMPSSTLSFPGVGSPGLSNVSQLGSTAAGGVQFPGGSSAFPTAHPSRRMPIFSTPTFCTFATGSADIPTLPEYPRRATQASFGPALPPDYICMATDTPSALPFHPSDTPWSWCSGAGKNCVDGRPMRSGIAFAQPSDPATLAAASTTFKALHDSLAALNGVGGLNFADGALAALRTPLLRLQAGEIYRVTVEYKNIEGFAACRLGWVTPGMGDAARAAARLAGLGGVGTGGGALSGILEHPNPSLPNYPASQAAAWDAAALAALVPQAIPSTVLFTLRHTAGSPTLTYIRPGPAAVTPNPAAPPTAAAAPPLLVAQRVIDFSSNVSFLSDGGLSPFAAGLPPLAYAGEGAFAGRLPTPSLGSRVLLGLLASPSQGMLPANSSGRQRRGPLASSTAGGAGVGERAGEPLVSGTAAEVVFTLKDALGNPRGGEAAEDAVWAQAQLVLADPAVVFSLAPSKGMVLTLAPRRPRPTAPPSRLRTLAIAPPARYPTGEGEAAFAPFPRRPLHSQATLGRLSTTWTPTIAGVYTVSTLVRWRDGSNASQQTPNLFLHTPGSPSPVLALPSATLHHQHSPVWGSGVHPTGGAAPALGPPASLAGGSGSSFSTLPGGAKPMEGGAVTSAFPAGASGYAGGAFTVLLHPRDAQGNALLIASSEVTGRFLGGWGGSSQVWGTSPTLGGGLRGEEGGPNRGMPSGPLTANRTLFETFPQVLETPLSQLPPHFPSLSVTAQSLDEPSLVYPAQVAAVTIPISPCPVTCATGRTWNGTVVTVFGVAVTLSVEPAAVPAVEASDFSAATATAAAAGGGGTVGAGNANDTSALLAAAYASLRPTMLAVVYVAVYRPLHAGLYTVSVVGGGGGGGKGGRKGSMGEFSHFGGSPYTVLVPPGPLSPSTCTLDNTTYYAAPTTTSSTLLYPTPYTLGNSALLLRRPNVTAWNDGTPLAALPPLYLPAAASPTMRTTRLLWGEPRGSRATYFTVTLRDALGNARVAQNASWVARVDATPATGPVGALYSDNTVSTMFPLETTPPLPTLGISAWTEWYSPWEGWDTTPGQGQAAPPNHPQPTASNASITYLGVGKGRLGVESFCGGALCKLYIALGGVQIAGSPFLYARGASLLDSAAAAAGSAALGSPAAPPQPSTLELSTRASLWGLGVLAPTAGLPAHALLTPRDASGMPCRGLSPAPTLPPLHPFSAFAQVGLSLASFPSFANAPGQVDTPSSAMLVGGYTPYTLPPGLTFSASVRRMGGIRSTDAVEVYYGLGGALGGTPPFTTSLSFSSTPLWAANASSLAALLAASPISGSTVPPPPIPRLVAPTSAQQLLGQLTAQPGGAYHGLPGGWGLKAPPPPLTPPPLRSAFLATSMPQQWSLNRQWGYIRGGHPWTRPPRALSPPWQTPGHSQRSG